MLDNIADKLRYFVSCNLIRI